MMVEIKVEEIGVKETGRLLLVYITRLPGGWVTPKVASGSWRE